MRSEQKTKIIPTYHKIYDENGEIFSIERAGEEAIIITELFADRGKQFVRISDGAFLGNRITLGTGDTAENYREN